MKAAPRDRYSGSTLVSFAHFLPDQVLSVLRVMVRRSHVRFSTTKNKIKKAIPPTPHIPTQKTQQHPAVNARRRNTPLRRLHATSTHLYILKNNKGRARWRTERARAPAGVTTSGTATAHQKERKKKTK
jgi:hypothetical protein